MTQQQDIVAGRIPVLECLRARRRKALELCVQDGARGLEAIRAAAAHLPVQERSREQLDQLTKGVMHQGVVLKAHPLPILGLPEWIKRGTGPNALLLVLDGIEDPQNFGGIVRTAAACGAAAVLFGKDRAAPISPAACKAAAGAMEHIDLIRVTNIARALTSLQEGGFWTAALAGEAETNLWDANLTGRIALVVGNEGKGVRKLVLEKCDLRLRIPITGPITSLNASVSAAIAMAECVRQRHTG